ncbi:MAG: ABC transporter ATP-binding protein [Armatimonadetes bacterium]|nr:ABC transporter ATP-binding protein [Armatimonadota bacterium]
MTSALIVENATIAYGDFVAVRSASFHVSPGECVALVGESGSGKTTLARAILGLQSLKSGSIMVAGSPIHGASAHQSERVGIVWQDPYASLDPRWKVGRSIREPATLIRRTIDLDALMNRVGLEPHLAERFPHQLSGGQRQRVAIARAVALQPPLLLCDEPTAALDLSVQAQILNVIREMIQAQKCACLYISHDLLTVRFIADRVVVMSKGEIVEQGDTEAVFHSPQHPYTQKLLQAAPKLHL